MGPGANGTGMSMATQQPLSGTPVHQPSTPGPTGPSAPPSGAMSQQNLNQIVGVCSVFSSPVLLDFCFFFCGGPCLPERHYSQQPMLFRCGASSLVNVLDIGRQRHHILPVLVMDDMRFM
jgi:hypothetical protein